MVISLFKKKEGPALQWTDKLASLADKQIPASENTADSRSVTLNESNWEPSRRRSSTPILGPDHPHPIVDIPLRLEGPYFTPADPLRYRTVICFVAGTGVSGAIAIAGAFAEMKREKAANLPVYHEVGPGGGPSKPSDPSIKIWERCVVVWSVRADDYVDLPFFKSNFTLTTLATAIPR